MSFQTTSTDAYVTVNGITDIGWRVPLEILLFN